MLPEHQIRKIYRVNSEPLDPQDLEDVCGKLSPSRDRFASYPSFDGGTILPPNPDLVELTDQIYNGTREE